MFSNLTSHQSDANYQSQSAGPHSDRKPKKTRFTAWKGLDIMHLPYIITDTRLGVAGSLQSVVNRLALEFLTHFQQMHLFEDCLLLKAMNNLGIDSVSLGK